MRHGLTLQTVNALILTLLVISIVSFILVKLSNPQPINDVGKFYDSIMNPTRTTPPTEDLLTLKNNQLILHTERIPPNTILTLTEHTPKGKKQHEYTRTHQPTIIQPTSTLGTITITLTQDNTKTQQAYAYTTGDLPTITLLTLYDGLVLQHAQTEETIHQLYNHCRLRDIPFERILTQSISSGSPFCSRPDLFTRQAGGKSAFFSRLIDCSLPIQGCRAYLFGACPNGEGSRAGRQALFLLILADTLQREADIAFYNTRILSMDVSFLDISPEEMREDILTRGSVITLDKLGLTCDERILLTRLA